MGSSPDKDDYIEFWNEEVSVTFVSAGVSRVCYDSIVEDGCNTVLYDIED